MKIVAVSYYKFDEDYLEDYKKNLSSLVDDFLLIEDKDGGFMYDEGKYRKRLIDGAKEMGADWVVVLDPDERLEKNAARKIKKMINKYHGKKVMFQLNFKELYLPRMYRIDGIWGKKNRIPIFPLLNDNVYSDKKIHTPKYPINKGYRIIKADINIYHLKHIKPELRKQRKDLYNKLDPNHKYQRIGYDYIDNEDGAKFAKIMPWRMYKPKYRDYKIDKGVFEI